MAKSKRRLLEAWSLFFLVTIPMSVAVVLKMSSLDMASALDISSMIQSSVRCSVPWLYLAFAASSLVVVFPGEPTRWLIRNRRYIGLCFATGMGWQLTFIVWMVAGHWGYYRNDVYALLDIAVQVPGYLILFLMTATSFRPARSRLSARQWRILHRTGIYFLWGTIWSTYWYELYDDDIQLIDHLFYWAGFAAWGIRILAWSRKGLKVATKDAPGGPIRPALLGVGLVAVAAGLLGIGLGSLWEPGVWGLFEIFGAAATWMELPVPFFPIFLIALGATLVVRSKRSPLRASLGGAGGGLRA